MNPASNEAGFLVIIIRFKNMKRIAIQGVPGSFHDIAAHKFFPNDEIELICCDTFEEIFEHMHQDSQVIGMLAIENTIAGSLLHNYELLRDSGTTVVGEHKLHITHVYSLHVPCRNPHFPHSYPQK